MNDVVSVSYVHALVFKNLGSNMFMLVHFYLGFWAVESTQIAVPKIWPPMGAVVNSD